MAGRSSRWRSGGTVTSYLVNDVFNFASTTPRVREWETGRKANRQTSRGREEEGGGGGGAGGENPAAPTHFAIALDARHDAVGAGARHACLEDDSLEDASLEVARFRRAPAASSDGKQTGKQANKQGRRGSPRRCHRTACQPRHCRCPRPSSLRSRLLQSQSRATLMVPATYIGPVPRQGDHAVAAAAGCLPRRHWPPRR